MGSVRVSWDIHTVTDLIEPNTTTAALLPLSALLLALLGALPVVVLGAVEMEPREPPSRTTGGLDIF